MASGLKAFDYDPPIVLSAEDWDAITRGGALLDRERCLDLANFEMAMRIQLGEYSQRLLANKMAGMAQTNGEMVPVLFAAKMAFLEIIEASADRRHSAALDVCFGLFVRLCVRACVRTCVRACVSACTSKAESDTEREKQRDRQRERERERD